MKISSLFKIKINKTTLVKDFYIGKIRFVIIELINKKTDIVNDPVVKFLLTSSLPVYWFENYNQFENNINYFIDYKKEQNIFVILDKQY